MRTAPRITAVLALLALALFALPAWAEDMGALYCGGGKGEVLAMCSGERSTKEAVTVSFSTCRMQGRDCVPLEQLASVECVQSGYFDTRMDCVVPGKGLVQRTCRHTESELGCLCAMLGATHCAGAWVSLSGLTKQDSLDRAAKERPQ